MQLQHGTVPAARLSDLVMTESGDEILVYDQAVQHIHHLNRVSATVWQLCDGQRGIGEISAAATSEMGTDVNEDAVKLALRQLDDAKLLDGELGSEFRGSTQSRRAFMKKAAVAGVAVPVLVSISAPSASATQTCPTCPNQGQVRCCTVPGFLSVNALVCVGRGNTSACVTGAIG